MTVLSQMGRLQGRVAVVTGAGRGIGAAIAQRFAAEGAQVAVVSRNMPNAQKVSDEINANFPNAARSYAVDVADRDAVTTARKSILADFGRVHILVNNAGVTRDSLFLRMSSQDWNEVIATNLTGVFNFTQEFLPSILRQKTEGRIIMISSVVGLMGNAGQVNYAATKAAVLGMALSLAREVAPRGVTVNAIVPGYIKTDMTSVLAEGVRQATLGKIPLERFGEVQDIAGLALFLAEAGYLTGTILRCDGGMSMSL